LTVALGPLHEIRSICSLIDCSHPGYTSDGDGIDGYSHGELEFQFGRKRNGVFCVIHRIEVWDDPKNPLHYLIRQRQVALPLYPQFGTEPNGYYIPPRWVPRSYLIQMLVQALFSDLANVGYWSPVAARNLFHLPPGHNRRRRAPPLLAGTYTAISPTARNPFEVEAEETRNGATGPGFFQLDLRAGYRLQRMQGRTLDAFVEVFNVTNRANFENPTGDRRSTDFLNLTTLRSGAVPTTVQLGLRFAF